MLHNILVRSLGAGLLIIGAAHAHAAVLTNPAIAPGSVLHWADSVSAFAPGPQDIAVIGSPAANAGVAANAVGAQNGSTVSLGDGGSITVQFATAIRDGAGADFAVFENAFTSSGKVFAEMAFVAVSSDGTHFASFASNYNNPAVNEAFGTGFRLTDISDVNNFAGIYNTGVGTGFDLLELASDPLVLAGMLDLSAIHFVRMIDVVGNGSTTDSFGHAILDPYPTAFASSGFDLDAVGALHVVPLPSSLGMMLAAIGLVASVSRRNRKG